MAKQAARLRVKGAHTFMAAPTVATCKVHATRLSELIIKPLWSLEFNLKVKIATVHRDRQKPPWICTDASSSILDLRLSDQPSKVLVGALFSSKVLTECHIIVYQNGSESGGLVTYSRHLHQQKARSIHVASTSSDNQAGPAKGDGTSDNQSHAVIFIRVEHVQLVDAMQDNYLEEALKVRSVLGEFEQLHTPDALPFSHQTTSMDAAELVAIVGAREYV
ncbi:MAG: 1,3-beta-glucan synthase component-domain-containing protein [Benniella sp.]|nr:MAG: 1,3-beta-glucan synthase component-domain-containing protein [Benniella sp.]